MFCVDHFLFLAVGFCVVTFGARVDAGNKVESGSLITNTDEGYTGMWFGPRLGKRTRATDSNDREAWLHLLESADILKYYYDHLPGDEKYRGSIDIGAVLAATRGLGEPLRQRRGETINYTPRLGRKLAKDNYPRRFKDNVLDDSDPPIFSPRLGRMADLHYSPRLGRNPYDYADDNDESSRKKRSVSHQVNK